MKDLVREGSRRVFAAGSAAPDPARHGLRVLAIVAVAAAVVGLLAFPWPSRPARAGLEDGVPKDGPTQVTPVDFVRDVRRTLRDADDRLIALVKQIRDQKDAA